LNVCDYWTLCSSSSTAHDSLPLLPIRRYVILQCRPCRQWIVFCHSIPSSGWLSAQQRSLSDRMLANRVVRWIQIPVAFIVTTIFKVYIPRGKRNELLSIFWFCFLCTNTFLHIQDYSQFNSALAIFSINIQQVCCSLMKLFAQEFCSVKLQNFVLALRSYVMDIVPSGLKVLLSVNAPCSYSAEELIQTEVTWPQVAAQVQHNQDGQKENMSANTVGRSLALQTRNRSVGVYKKLSPETSFNLQLLRSTHNIESEFKIWVCASERKSGFQCRENISKSESSGNIRVMFIFCCY
jgi:hypothetical protein